MEKDLEIYLDQIVKIIDELKSNDEDPEKLNELELSLDLLSNKIKAVRLKQFEFDLPEITAEEKIKQDGCVYFDHNFKLIRIIGALDNIFGKNKKIPDLQKIFTKEDFEFLKSKISTVHSTGKPQTFKTRVIAANDILLPVKIRLEKINQEGEKKIIAAGFVFSEQNPEDLKDYQEILIQNLPDLDVCLFDTNFRHVLAGGKEKERFKMTNEDFNGKTFFEVYNEKLQKRLYPFYKNALDGKLTEGEVRMDKEIYFVSSTPVYDINENVMGGALVAQNVTKEKQIENNLIRAKKEAEEADKTKSLFLARMSHEIRTPLNSIVGFTDLLYKTGLGAEQKKYSDLISQSSEHLLSVVNEILFMFKIGMGKVFIDKVPFHPKDVVHEVYDSLILKAREKNIDFKINIDEQIPETLIGDPFRIRQILINLVSNAIKFTDKGMVSADVYLENKTRKKANIRFEIKDTGVGIPKRHLDKIFKEFSQIESAKSERGLGLGLTIAKKLVELLGGKITVNSKLNKGSSFTVIIPFKISKRLKPAQTRKKYEIKYDLLKGKKFLVADDDEYNILLSETLLERWKTNFKVALNGRQAIEMLGKEQFDIILLDIHMPELSGVEVIKKIRADNGFINQKTKAIAVTANILKSDIDFYMKNGFDDYITKPFREEDLYNRICSLLDIAPDIQTESQNNNKTINDFSNKKEIFDISMLKETAGNNAVFFNKMLDTFIQNAIKTKEIFEADLASENWDDAGETAHKVIPSFKYFGLSETVSGLSELETATLRTKKYTDVPVIIRNLIKKIENTIVLAENAKIINVENKKN